MPRPTSVLFLTLLAWHDPVLASETDLRRADWGPWDERWAPVGAVEATPGPPPPRSGVFERAYRFYRARISSRDGAKCSFYPTCSGYAILAVREHGPFVGGLYALDRLIYRDNPWRKPDDYPLVTPHGVVRQYDPVPERRERRSAAKERS
jgi:putative component of membrane protein insertase Oxa1/YidC/SpoIIIJ protein YidD